MNFIKQLFVIVVVVICGGAIYFVVRNSANKIDDVNIQGRQSPHHDYCSSDSECTGSRKCTCTRSNRNYCC